MIPDLSPIAVVEAVAALFWVYAALAGIEWAAGLARTPRSRHIPLVTEMIGHLVPAMIMLVVVVMAGAFFGFPTVVVVIAILFPAGLAFGLHGALNDLRETEMLREGLRLALTLVIGAAVIWWRGS